MKNDSQWDKYGLRITKAALQEKKKKKVNKTKNASEASTVTLETDFYIIEKDNQIYSA